MPDPLATRTTGKHRYNFMFQYAPKSTRMWPISGLNGFEPKPEYHDYVMSKLNCPVCSEKIPGCDNPVAHEYGQPKPFCQEHMREAPYAQELMGKYGGPGLPGQPDPNQDYRDVEAQWKNTRADWLKPGDKVKLGKQTGTLLEIDPEMEDRTHRVRWDAPKTKALEITWVDPSTLDLVE